MTDCGCFYILNHDIARNVQKLIDIKPLDIYKLNRDIGIDLDEEKDWENLETVYHKMKTN